MNCTAGALTATFADAASLGDGFFVTIRHAGTANQIKIIGDGVDTFDIGVPAMGVYMATTEPPRFLTPDDEWRTAVSAGLAGFPEDAIEYGRAPR